MCETAGAMEVSNGRSPLRVDRGGLSSHPFGIILSVDDVRGEHGELIDRLVGVLAGETPAGSEWWDDVGHIVARSIGGADLKRAWPEPDPSKVQGMGRYKPTGKEDYLALVRGRLLWVVKHGLSEPFVVRSVRHEITTEYATFADRDLANRGRAEFRAFVLASAEDPVRNERIRARRPGMSDTDLVKEARELAATAPYMQPVTDEDLRGKQAALEAWTTAAAAISDDVIHRWVLAAGGIVKNSWGGVFLNDKRRAR